jgi:hypothetical protein
MTAMELSDPDASRAVLIGVHSYAKLPELPAVERNLADLRAALTDSEIWGLPPGNCRVVPQPDNAGAVLNAVIEAGREATDTLVVYYAGHGLTDPHSDELYLTLPGSDPEFTATALAYEFLRRAVRDPRIRAPRKVVILDCCYSGRAVEGGMGVVTANQIVTDGTQVLTASGATQRAWSPPGEEHTAFTGELITVLEQGIPGGPDLLTTDAIYRHVQTELRAKARPMPQQLNRNAGGDIVLARNRAVSGTPFRRPVRPPPQGGVLRRVLNSWRSWRWAAKLALVVAVTLAVTSATAVFLAWGGGPIQDCDTIDREPGAKTTYSCKDRNGRTAAVEAFPDGKTLDAAYERIVADADVPKSTGDCGTEEDAEHRYPVTGPAQGRVLCYTDDRTTTVLWTDDKAHTVTRIQAPVADKKDLRSSWAAPAPPFPTTAEQALIDLPVAAGCARAGVEEMDDFPGAFAAVTCAETGGAGAQSVTYFQFDSLPKLRETMTSHIPAGKDPTAPGCQDGLAPKFTDARRYDVRGVFLGLLLCRPAIDGNLVMEWSVEALRLAARAVGTDAAGLSRWWRVNRGPPIERVVKAVNDDTKFLQDPAEKALYDLIPPNSRRFCMRPSGEFKTEHVHRNRKAIGIVCGPRIGPAIVFYYRFENKADLIDNFRPRATARPCTESPTAVSGEAAYTRGATKGWLRCEYRDGDLARTWTDERRLIQAYAFQGRDPVAMSDWWEHDAGPL